MVQQISGVKLPEIDLKELEKIKKQNFRERLEFQDWYVNWMKAKDNVKWSSAQTDIINRKSGDSKRSYRSAVEASHARRRSKN
ncbi:MAG: hypothetical protein ACRD5H_13280 [Nitrososphaerales archaeon]